MIIIVILIILIVQFQLNYGIAYLIKPRSIARYKVVSYILFTFFAISIPIILVIQLYTEFQRSNIEDPSAYSTDLDSILLCIGLIIGMTGVQLFFNQRILPGMIMKMQKK